MDDFDRAVEQALKSHPGGKTAPPPAEMPTDIDAAVEMALKMHPKGSERRIPKFQQFLESTAALGDVTVGGVLPAAAPVVRAMARPFTSAEQADKIREDYLKYTAQPFGKALGITESPYYKGEALNRLTAFVGENVDKGVDWMASQTGVPKGDLQNMIEILGIGAGVKAAPTVAKVGMKGAEKVEGAISAATQAVGPTVSKVAEKFTPMEVTMAQRALGMGKPQDARAMGSVGAAGVEPPAMRQANIEAALVNASPETNRFIISQDQTNVNLPALQVKSLEDKHQIKLSQGQRTSDTSRYAREWNARGGEGNPIGDLFKEQPTQLAAAIDRARIERAPDINDVEPSALGQKIIDGLAAKDQLRREAINNAYQALANENGGKFPIDLGKLQQNVTNALDAENASPYFEKTPFESAVNSFYKDPSFQRFEALRTQAANILRSNADGNTKRVAWIVRNELENMPVFGEGTGTPQAIKLKALADEARKLTKERKDIIESNLAYRAAINEATDAASAASQGESINAAKFHQKYAAGATPEGVRRLKAELLEGDPANQALIAAEFERAKNSLVSATENNVKSEMFAAFLKKNAPLLRETMGPEAFNDLFEIGILSGKIAKPQSGVFNYSNSYSALASELAKDGLLQLGEAKLAMSTGGASIPALGGARAFAERMSKNRFAAETLNPFGGLTLQDLGKVNPNAPPLKAARSTYGASVPLKDIGKD